MLYAAFALRPVARPSTSIFRGISSQKPLPMNKEFTKVVLVSLGVVLLIPVTMLRGGGDGYLIGIGITAFFVAIFELLVGFVLLFPGSTRNYGAAMLMTAGLLLLTSFTVCSNSRM